MTSYLIILLPFLLAIFNKKSKLLLFIILALMFILMGYNYYNADYYMYERIYNSYGITSTFTYTEGLFQLMCQFFYKIGFNYQKFLTVYSFICLFIIYLTLSRISKYRSLAISMYLICPFFVDAVQIRHFLATCFVCYGLTFLLLEDDNIKKNISKYIILNIIACGFHTSAFIYFIFLLYPIFKKKKIKDTFILFFIIAIVATLLMRSKLFINMLNYIIPSSKMEAYFLTGKYVSKSFIISILFVIVQCIPIASMLFLKKLFKGQEEDKNVKFLDSVIILNILLLITIPLYFYSYEFVRLFRGILLINYIAITNILGERLRRNDFVVLLIILLLLLSMFMVFFILNGTFDATIRAILEFNSIFERW